ncbi:MAG: aquaporin [Acidobacteria bacterium]|nr:aquaporin [Acidobacteriota bacterium]
MRRFSEQHWPEYLMEAWGLGVFMVSACGFGLLLEHPASPWHQAVADPFSRRFLMGLAMGLTAIGIVYSPWGKRSGAHLNPSMTLTFLWLGKIRLKDAVYYILAQFAGGLIGVGLVVLILRDALAHPSVGYVTTVPRHAGTGTAWFAEFGISLLMMFVVLNVSNRPGLGRYTGLFAGSLVAAYITFEAPFSGMSMNPARTFGSAFAARIWDGLWIYFTAPPFGMLLAAWVFVRRRGRAGVTCAKLHHQNRERCIFNCGYRKLNPSTL